MQFAITSNGKPVLYIPQYMTRADLKHALRSLRSQGATPHHVLVGALVNELKPKKK